LIREQQKGLQGDEPTGASYVFPANPHLLVPGKKAAMIFRSLTNQAIIEKTSSDNLL
jgi:hypothetical protein